MEVIHRKQDLYENITQVERYLACEEGEELRAEMIKLILRGHNFVSYKIDAEWHFVPSKYIGYKDNNLIVHNANKEEHSITGLETDPSITKVLEIKKQPNEVLEEAYYRFCQQLGIPANKMHKRVHKFWRLSIPEKYFDTVLDKGHGYTEGKVKIIRHKRRERNPKLVQDAKAKFRREHDGKLFCEICEFDFSEKYGDAGIDFIEAHHIRPISEMSEKGEVLNVDDLRMVCSNCHSIIHHRVPFFTIEEVKKMYKY